ncbi:hypothetical protein HPB50_006592 [Hyalomma asiaticum]|uniref:Uncharacterized protein n=1 Tax=Hyalomma asiaticum TaxID=266040 RepID=A0ACB7SK52_HYAAI|nr:hypothetical protein HPB50_006592 [Hyalomma asiaticum]
MIGFPNCNPIIAAPPELNARSATLVCETTSSLRTGNVTGEEILRQAFPAVKLERFPNESEMVANLSVRTNALGLANNYGVVFERAEEGMLSYKLRFPSWQEFYTRQTFVGSDPKKQAPFWLNGILLPMVSGLNLAVARAESARLDNPLPPVYFQTRRFPAPKAKGWGGGARRIADLCVVYGFIVIAPVAVKRIADEKSVGMKVVDAAAADDYQYRLRCKARRNRLSSFAAIGSDGSDGEADEAA